MQKIFLGTYTRRISEGIYQINLDSSTNSLKDLKLITAAQNPTYLDFDAETSKLYAVHQEDTKGGIAVYDYKDGVATLDFTRLSEGVQPCYVHYDKHAQAIYEANYHLGMVTITKDKKEVQAIKYGEGAKAHFVDVDPKTNAVFVCDLGNDTVHKYVDLKEVASYTGAKGMGPRHIAFHPTLNIFYVFGELNNTIDVIKDEESTLTHVQTLSTLPEGDFKSSGAAIRVSADGRYVYASNRGHDSIAIYKIDDAGSLTFLETVSTEGEHPRDFDISPDQKYLVVANMMSDNLTLFARDEETGLLTVLEKDIFAPETVCVKFVG